MYTRGTLLLPMYPRGRNTSSPCTCTPSVDTYPHVPQRGTRIPYRPWGGGGGGHLMYTHEPLRARILIQMNPRAATSTCTPSGPLNSPRGTFLPVARSREPFPMIHFEIYYKFQYSILLKWIGLHYDSPPPPKKKKKIKEKGTGPQAPSSEQVHCESLICI